MKINTYEIQAYVDQVEINLNTLRQTLNGTEEYLNEIKKLLPDDRQHEFYIKGPTRLWIDPIRAKSPSETIEKARKIIDEQGKEDGDYRVVCGRSQVRRFTHKKGSRPMG